MCIYNFIIVDDENGPEKKKDKDGEEGEEADEDDEMMAMLGFSSFNTTKGKTVDDNLAGPASGAVAKHTTRKYRQYMNKKRPPGQSDEGNQMFPGGY